MGFPANPMSNSSAKSNFAIAHQEITQYLSKQADLIAPEPKRTIPQRKACYHNKNRIRRRDVQVWVFRRTGLNTTAEVKRYLKKLGHCGDGRLTTFWLNVNLNHAGAIAQLVKSDEAAIATPTIKVGNLVEPIEYTARTVHWQAWSPFQVMEVIGTEAKLDMIKKLIPLSQLKLVS